MSKQDAHTWRTIAIALLFALVWSLVIGLTNLDLAREARRELRSFKDTHVCVEVK